MGHRDYHQQFGLIILSSAEKFSRFFVDFLNKIKKCLDFDANPISGLGRLAHDFGDDCIVTNQEASQLGQVLILFNACLCGCVNAGAEMLASRGWRMWRQLSSVEFRRLSL